PAPYALPSGNYIYRETIASAAAKLFVWGGDEYSPSTIVRDHADGAMFDPVTGAWTPLPASTLTARDGALAVWTGCDVIVFGGWDHDAAVDGRKSDGAF